LGGNPGGNPGGHSGGPPADIVAVYHRLGGQLARDTGRRGAAHALAANQLAHCLNTGAHQHGDRNPSMSLNAQKGVFRCFGCGWQGGVLDLVEGVLRTDRQGARDWLRSAFPGSLPEPAARSANWGSAKTGSVGRSGFSQVRSAGPQPAGPQPPVSQPPAQPQLFGVRPNLAFAPLYAHFRAACLAHNPGGTALLPAHADYLASRGFHAGHQHTWGWFSVGDYRAASADLKSAFSLDALQAAGLFNAKGNLIFYGHRLVLPFYYDGQIGYLQARQVPVAGASSAASGARPLPKYLNLRRTPQQPGFPLFHADVLSRTPNAPTITVYLTEGAFNTIALAACGASAVAIGSAANVARAAAHWLPAFGQRRVVLALDADAAGLAATHALQRLWVLHRGRKPRALQLPAGQDVNDVLRARLLAQESPVFTAQELRDLESLLADPPAGPLSAASSASPSPSSLSSAADVSTGDVPTADVPTGDVSTGDVSAADVSASDVPTGDVSTGDVPS